MKKLLITGASGFIGRYLSSYLRENREYEVYAPSSKELNLIDESSVKDYFRQKSFDIVIHTALYDYIRMNADKTKVLSYNLRMYYNLLNCKEHYGKMIATGSGAEYDKRYPIAEVHEEEIGRSVPVDDYGLSKYIIGMDIEHQADIYNLRLFGVFGYGEDYLSKFISNACCKALKNINISIRQNVYFDYIYVEDLCRLIEKFIEIDKPKFHSYNLCSGLKIDLLSIAEFISTEYMDYKEIWVANKGLGREYSGNNSRIREELGSFKLSDWKTAVKKTYEAYKKNIAYIDYYKLLYGRE